jgi:lipocalin
MDPYISTRKAKALIVGLMSTKNWKVLTRRITISNQSISEMINIFNNLRV